MSFDIDTDKSVETLIEKKFGIKNAPKILAAISRCTGKANVTEMEDCIKRELKIENFMAWEQDAIWDFLYHFVIVG